MIIRQNKKILLSLWLLASLFCQAIPVLAQQSSGSLSAVVPESGSQDADQIFTNILRQNRGAEFSAIMEKILGSDAERFRNAFEKEWERLFQAVTTGASRKAEETLYRQIEERRQKPYAAPPVKAAPRAKPYKKPVPGSKKVGFNVQPKSLWRQFAFGFQALESPQDSPPEVKFTQTDREIIASGETKKSFETTDAKGTRTQKAETRHKSDGKTFGVEIKNTQIIEAVSKIDGKTFRTETVMMWGAEVAACPDAEGITSGTGHAKVNSKTIFSEGVQAAVTISTDFDLRAKLTGYVNDGAELTHYDLQIDAFVTNSGQEDALRRKLTKEIKLKDGRYGIRYDIAGNTVEISDGKYGGERTPAKMGKATGQKLTAMSDTDTAHVNSAFGSMVPAIWYSAGEMYESAQKNWKGGGCVEVICKAPKTELKTGETIDISAETVHLQDKSKVNAQLKAEAGDGTVAPESQAAAPGATFTFTAEGENSSYFTVESVSKRGIGKGGITFEKELEEPSEAGAWTGTIEVRRFQYVEREKRTGANLAENGGYFETVTDVMLKFTGRLDRTVEATNANIAVVNGDQTHTDYEYDRYKIDEGYCGPNATPYQGPKEITRTSRTKALFNREIRVYTDIGGTSGTITFSLPDTNGQTVHSYVHSSPCAEHDRANTNEAVDEEAASPGGNFSFSFPVDSSQKTIRGTLNVTEEDGSKTDYTWALRRK